MAVRSGSDSDKRAMLEIYVSDLWTVPLFALKAACKAYRSGEMGDGQWAPTPAMLRKAADQFARMLRDEQRNLGRLLSAKVVDVVRDPQVKARNVAKAAELIAELSQGADPSYLRKKAARPLTKDEAEGWLDREAQKPAPECKLSDAVLEKMRLER